VHTAGPCIASWHEARARQQRRVDPRYLTLFPRLLLLSLPICSTSPSSPPRPVSASPCADEVPPYCRQASWSESERARVGPLAVGCGFGCDSLTTSCRVVSCRWNPDVLKLDAQRLVLYLPITTTHSLTLRPCPRRAYRAKHLAAAV
jgi:hypothetical protein